MTDQAKDGMTQGLMSREATALLLEKVVVGGDLSKLSAEERMRYYAAVCQSVGLNPMTQPFQYLYLQNKMTLYARKEATEQLREIHEVSVTKLERELIDDGQESLYAVTAYGVNKAGRSDSSLGVVPITGLHGEQKANAMMKAETKAKRRLTLSLCGLGLLDESEIDVAPGVGVVAAAEGEQKILFPTPEQDRAGLIMRAKIATARLDKARAAAQKKELFGDENAKYDQVDLAALVAYVQWAESFPL